MLAGVSVAPWNDRPALHCTALRGAVVRAETSVVVEAGRGKDAAERSRAYGARTAHIQWRHGTALHFEMTPMAHTIVARCTIACIPVACHCWAVVNTTLVFYFHVKLIEESNTDSAMHSVYSRSTLPSTTLLVTLTLSTCYRHHRTSRTLFRLDDAGSYLLHPFSPILQQILLLFRVSV